MFISVGSVRVVWKLPCCLPFREVQILLQCSCVWAEEDLDNSIDSCVSICAMYQSQSVHHVELSLTYSSILAAHCYPSVRSVQYHRVSIEETSGGTNLNCLWTQYRASLLGVMLWIAMLKESKLLVRFSTTKMQF